MTRFGFAIVAAAVVLSSCGDNGVPAAQNYAVVFGRVYDASTNQPVAGVEVAVDVVDTVTTAADGTYSVANVPLGQTDVAVSVPAGYAVASPASLNFSVVAGDRYRLDIPLNHS
jgi:hypothetical protein